MRLIEVEVKGVRCLRDAVSVRLLSPTVLTGPNDVGKSTFLRSVRFLLGNQNLSGADLSIIGSIEGDDSSTDEPERVDQCFVAGTFIQRNALGGESELRVRRLFHATRGAKYETEILAPVDVRLRDLDNCSLNELKTRAMDLGVEPVGSRSAKRSWLEPLRSLAELGPKEQCWISAPKTLIDAFPRVVVFDSSLDPNSAIKSALSEAFKQAAADGKIKAQLEKVEHSIARVVKKEAARLEGHLRARCPDLTGVRIEPRVSLRDNSPIVDIRTTQGDGHLVDLSVSGAGKRQRIALAAWEFTQGVLEARKSGGPELVVLYDEPDTHLDYSKQRELADIVRQQAGVDGVSVVVATHSLNLIDRVPIGNVAHFVSTDGVTSVERLLTDDHDETDAFLARVADSMGLRTSVLLHERCFVAVEGVTEAQAIPILFRLSQGIQLQSAGIALLNGESNLGALKIARHLASRGRPVRVIVDNDTYREESVRKHFSEPQLRSYGIEPAHVYGLGDNEIEDLFSDTCWAQAANLLWPRNDGRDWTDADFSQHRSGKFSALVGDMLQVNSDSGPQSKQSLLTDLAGTLTVRGDLPDVLNSVFDELSLIGAG